MQLSHASPTNQISFNLIQHLLPYLTHILKYNYICLTMPPVLLKSVFWHLSFVKKLNYMIFRTFFIISHPDDQDSWVAFNNSALGSSLPAYICLDRQHLAVHIDIRRYGTKLRRLHSFYSILYLVNCS